MHTHHIHTDTHTQKHKHVQTPKYALHTLNTSVLGLPNEVNKDAHFFSHLVAPAPDKISHFLLSFFCSLPLARTHRALAAMNHADLPETAAI